ARSGVPRARPRVWGAAGPVPSPGPQEPVWVPPGPLCVSTRRAAPGAIGGVPPCEHIPSPCAPQDTGGRVPTGLLCVCAGGYAAFVHHWLFGAHSTEIIAVWLPRVNVSYA